MNWDLYLRQTVTLALKGKGERPKDFKGNKKRGKILGMGPLHPKGVPKLDPSSSMFGGINSGAGAPAIPTQSSPT